MLGNDDEVFVKGGESSWSWGERGALGLVGPESLPFSRWGGSKTAASNFQGHQGQSLENV